MGGEMDSSRETLHRPSEIFRVLDSLISFSLLIHFTVCEHGSGVNTEQVNVSLSSFFCSLTDEGKGERKTTERQRHHWNDDHGLKVEIKICDGRTHWWQQTNQSQHLHRFGLLNCLTVDRRKGLRLHLWGSWWSDSNSQTDSVCLVYEIKSDHHKPALVLIWNYRTTKQYGCIPADSWSGFHSSKLFVHVRSGIFCLQL